MTDFRFSGGRKTNGPWIHEKRHMNIWGGEEEVAPETFLGEKSWKI